MGDQNRDFHLPQFPCSLLVLSIPNGQGLSRFDDSATFVRRSWVVLGWFCGEGRANCDDLCRASSLTRASIPKATTAACVGGHTDSNAATVMRWLESEARHIAVSSASTSDQS